MNSASKDRLFVFICLALGFLFCEFFLFEGYGIGLPAVMVLFYAAVFWYLKEKPAASGELGARPCEIQPKGLWLLILIALLSACFALFDNEVLLTLDFMLLVALVALQLATMTGNRLYKLFSLGLAIDLFHVGVALPLVNVPAPFRAFKRRSAAPGKASRFGPILIGLAISVPLLAVVIALLASADIVFNDYVHNILEFLNRHITEYMFKLIVGAIGAIPLFGLLSALKNGRRINGLKFKVNYDRVKVVDEGVAITVLTLVNVVYLAFIVVQFGYLFNAFSSILPSGFTYAKYAQKGFIQLMAVIVINLGLLSLSMLFSRSQGKAGPKFLKTSEATLVALTLLLAASEMAKMVMYMDAYGLTLMRVYVAWFIVLCSVFFGAMFIKLFVKKFALTRFCFGAFVALFLALNAADVDARIAQYNVDRYLSGSLKTVDVDMFYDLSDSMIPYAAKLLDCKDVTIRVNTMDLLEARADIRNDNRWQVISVARENAKNVLKSKGITYLPRQNYSGD